MTNDELAEEKTSFSLGNVDPNDWPIRFSVKLAMLALFNARLLLHQQVIALFYHKTTYSPGSADLNDWLIRFSLK